ncbi:MAG: shikimate dehydrogenase family protein [Christensenellales bacterium]
MSITYDVTTKLAGLVGDPVSQSMLPKAYNALIRHYGINAVFLPFTVKKGNIQAMVDAAKASGMSGLVITMPHKADIVKHLDFVDEPARIYQCVNTVRIRDNTTYGYGTDGYGQCQSLESTGFRFAGRNGLIIGAGAICGMIADEMVKRGAKELYILNRTEGKAHLLAEKLRIHAKVPVTAGELTNQALDIAASHVSVIMQCTPMGLKGHGVDFSYLDFVDKLPADSAIADVISNPAVTALMQKAKSRGLIAINGLGMIAHQTRLIFERLFDFIPDEHAEELTLKFLYQALRGEL